MQTIRIMDPDTRIEGHMKVEITMDEVIASFIENYTQRVDP